MLTNQFVSDEKRLSGKHVGTGSNLIMQGLAGVTYSIMAILNLIKTHPPQSIPMYVLMKYSLESTVFLLWAMHCQCINIKISQSNLYRNNKFKTLSGTQMCGFSLPDYRIVRCDYQLGSSSGALCQSVDTILKPKSRQQTIATRLQLMVMRLIAWRQKHTNNCCHIFTQTTAIFILGKNNNSISRNVRQFNKEYWRVSGLCVSVKIKRIDRKMFYWLMELPCMSKEFLFANKYVLRKKSWGWLDKMLHITS